MEFMEILKIILYVILFVIGVSAILFIIGNVLNI